MFRRHRISDVSTIRSKKKFLTDKDSCHRLKHLRILIDHLSSDELQTLFLENSSFIFLNFSEVFFSYESDVKQKANSGFAKDIDTVLVVFEKILLLLPDLIHKRWQFNCIIEIIGELLNVKNALSIRKQALRLFLIWYQILGVNATTNCHRLFSHLVPEFGGLITEYQKREETNLSKSIYSSSTETQVQRALHPSASDINVNFRGINYVLPREPIYFPAWVIGDEDTTEDETLTLLRHLLRYMVTESSKVEWVQMRREQHLLQLWFLFEQLKHSYLPVIFPCLCPLYSIYVPFEVLSNSTQPNMSSVVESYPIPPERLLIYQEEFVCWLSTFVYAGSAPSNIRFMSADSGLSFTSNSHVVSGDNPANISSAVNFNEVSNVFDESTVNHRSHSPGLPKSNFPQDSEVISRPLNVDVFSVHDSANEQVFNTTSPRSKEFSTSLKEYNSEYPVRSTHPSTTSRLSVLEPNMYYSATVLNMVREVLYGCRQNINLIQDIFHQALLLPIQRHKALYAVVTVYDSWLVFKNQRPIFLQSLDLPINKPNQKFLFLHSKFSPTGNTQPEKADELEEVHLPSSESLCNAANDSSSLSQAMRPTNSVSLDSKIISSFPNSATSSMKRVALNDTNRYTEELRGCLQNTIQIMLQNMTNVFYASYSIGSHALCSPDIIECIKHQVDLCRFILQIFRFATKTNELSTQTWLKLLSVLMDIMRKTMIRTSPSDVQAYKWLSNDKLTLNLFQTLNGALLRATLFSSIGSEPWDQCLSVYSQLTHWPSLLVEWRKVMDMLTVFMAKHVYGVNLSELPQEKKGRRGKHLAASSSVRKIRPRSYTEAAFGQNTITAMNPPTTYPSALSIMGAHTNSLDDNNNNTSSDNSVPVKSTGLHQMDLTKPTHSINGSTTNRNELKLPPTNENWISEVKCVGEGIDNDSKHQDSFDDVKGNTTSSDLNDTLMEGLNRNDADTLVRNQSLSQSLLMSDKSDNSTSKNSIGSAPFRRVASDLNFHCEAPAQNTIPSMFHSRSGQVDNNSNANCVPLKPHRFCNSFDKTELSQKFIGRSFDYRPTTVAVHGADEDSLSMSHNEVSPNSFISGEEAPDTGLNFHFDSSHNPEDDVLNKNDDDNLSPLDLCKDLRKPGDTLTASTVPDSENLPKSHLLITNPQLTNVYDLPRCILAGGSAMGWTYEAVIVCWRRFIGLLGNFNDTCSPLTLLAVYNYFTGMINVFLKVTQHQLLPPITDSCIQPLPPLLPPIDYIAAILFETWELSDNYCEAKVLAIRMLCDILLKRPQMSHNLQLVSQFYHLTHRIVTSGDERFVFELIRSCNVRLFHSMLPSNQLLILDLFNAARMVLNCNNSNLDAPKTEALHVIINLLCYPNHFGILEAIDPDSVEPKLITCTDLKLQLINVLINTALTNSVVEVRCVSVIGLVMYLVIELMNSTCKSLNVVHQQPVHDDHSTSACDEHNNNAIVTDNLLFDVFVTLLAVMRLYDQTVGLVTVEMLLMLADYCEIIYLQNTKLPFHIILCLTWTLHAIWKSINLDKLTIIVQRYFVTILHALIEWTMSIPFNDLVLPIIEQESGEPPMSLMCFLMHVLCSIAACGTDNFYECTTFSFTKCPDPLQDLTSFCKQPVDTSFFTFTNQESKRFPPASNSAIGSNKITSENSLVESIRLVARVTISHLLNNVDQYPMTHQGAQLGTSVQEHHDYFDSLFETGADSEPELDANVFKKKNIQMFVIDRSILVTFITLPRLSNTKVAQNHHDLNKVGQNSSLYSTLNFNVFDKQSGESCVISDQSYTRIIIRDATGKYCWDASRLYGLCFGNESTSYNTMQSDASLPRSQPPPCPPPRSNPNPPPLNQAADDNYTNSPDYLNDLLNELAASSPECSIVWGPTAPGENGLKDVTESEKIPCANLEKMTLDQILAQCQLDEEKMQKSTTDILSCYSPTWNCWPLSSSLSPNSIKSLSDIDSTNNSTANNNGCVDFKQVEDITRHLLNHLGYLSWRTRPVIELLDQSPGLVRELKYLDKLGFRETHKLAVFYVGAGREDKQAILSTQAASLEFENFLAGLGWEIDLLNHPGYRGGLERSGRVGVSTPYYVTSTLEVIFHVSTRMPSSTQEDLKYKHLGNDEVMIIWNENCRPFRRSILRTQFGDVLIIISPLLNGLYSVEVRRESQIGFFGPIVESAILTATILPGLVRATAINASRAIRGAKTNYQHQYKDRLTCLQQIISKYISPTCFEDYAQHILSPGLRADSSSPPLASPQPVPEIAPEQSVQNASKEQKPSIACIQPIISAYNPQAVLSIPRHSTNPTREIPVLPNPSDHLLSIPRGGLNRSHTVHAVRPCESHRYRQQQHVDVLHLQPKLGQPLSRFPLNHGLRVCTHNSYPVNANFRDTSQCEPVSANTADLVAPFHHPRVGQLIANNASVIRPLPNNSSLHPRNVKSLYFPDHG